MNQYTIILNVDGYNLISMRVSTDSITVLSDDTLVINGLTLHFDDGINNVDRNGDRVWTYGDNTVTV